MKRISAALIVIFILSSFIPAWGTETAKERYYDWRSYYTYPSFFLEGLTLAGEPFDIDNPPDDFGWEVDESFEKGTWDYESACYTFFHENSYTFEWHGIAFNCAEEPPYTSDGNGCSESEEYFRAWGDYFTRLATGEPYVNAEINNDILNTLLPGPHLGDYYALVKLDDKKSSLNVRKEPSTSSAIVEKLSHGRRVVVTDELDDGWVKITYLMDIETYTDEAGEIHAKTTPLSGYVKKKYLKEE